MKTKGSEVGSLDPGVRNPNVDVRREMLINQGLPVLHLTSHIPHLTSIPRKLLLISVFDIRNRNAMTGD
jgi:hypothetical protein